MFKCILLFVFFILAVLYFWITSQLSIGFEVAQDPVSQKNIVSSVSPELHNQGLKTNTELKSIGNVDKKLYVNIENIIATPVQRQLSYNNKLEYFVDQDTMRTIFSEPTIQLIFTDQTTLDITIDSNNSLREIPQTTWLRLLLGLMTALAGLAVWLRNPYGKSTTYYAISGVGFLLMIIPSAIDSIPMLLRSYSEMFVLNSIGAVGNYIYLTFGVATLLYFPQKLPAADSIAKVMFTVISFYSVWALINTWNFDVTIQQQLLYFSDLEVHIPVLIGFILVVYFSFQQWRYSQHKPVERARSSWVVLSWSVGLSTYMLFYYVPTISGYEPPMGRTWAWIAVCTSYWLVLLSLSRTQLFDLEHNINKVWEWLIVFVIFLLIDMVFVSLAIITPQLSTLFILCLVLWVYMPLREWLSLRMVRKKAASKNKLFSNTIAQLLSANKGDLKDSWEELLLQVFSPRAISWRKDVTETAIVDDGQGLEVSASRFFPAVYLEFAEQGDRLFNLDDVELAVIMSALLEQLFEFHLAFVAGQNQERERIRRDLHDQIGHKLLSLIYAAKDERVKALAQETLEQLRGVITALNLESVSLQSTLMEIRSVAEQASDNLGISLTWRNSVTDTSIVVGSYQYLNILNIARELLNNIIRHAQANQLSIILSVSDSRLIIVLIDNGIGFDRENIIMGNGLYNIDARVRELNATIDWNIHNGCKVTISIPLNLTNEE
jgi:signal transduction histidine kinase